MGVKGVCARWNGSVGELKGNSIRWWVMGTARCGLKGLCRVGVVGSGDGVLFRW